MKKTVFVSGCYDLLHSGHIRFFEKASEFGNLFVSIGADKTIEKLKKRKLVTTEKERLYMVKSIKYVHDACISPGLDSFNFLPDFLRVKPDIFVVNEDGDSPEKRKLCEENGVEYIVLKREPKVGLPKRSTTKLLNEIKDNYR